jgi:CspA family cold shock protein
VGLQFLQKTRIGVEKAGIAWSIGYNSFVSQAGQVVTRPSVPGKRLVMITGKVKWFNDQKGYGFLVADDGREVFVHHTAINMQGHRTLYEGQPVEFEVVQGPKGLQARNVVPK